MRHLGDYYTEVLQQKLNEIEESEKIYYHIEFDDETKWEVSPFKLRNLLSGKCNQKFEELTKIGSPSKSNQSYK